MIWQHSNEIQRSESYQRTHKELVFHKLKRTTVAVNGLLRYLTLKIAFLLKKQHISNLINRLHISEMNGAIFLKIYDIVKYFRGHLSHFSEFWKIQKWPLGLEKIGKKWPFWQFYNIIWYISTKISAIDLKFSPSMFNISMLLFINFLTD